MHTQEYCRRSVEFWLLLAVEGEASGNHVAASIRLANAIHYEAMADALAEEQNLLEIERNME